MLEDVIVTGFEEEENEKKKKEMGEEERNEENIETKQFIGMIGKSSKDLHLKLKESNKKRKFYCSIWANLNYTKNFADVCDEREKSKQTNENSSTKPEDILLPANSFHTTNN